MGEIAEMLIDGTLDFITGEYIGEGGGFPRTYHGRREYSKRNKYQGVVNYIKSRFPKQDDINFLLDAYADEHKLIVQVTNRNKINYFICEHIQENFKEFKNWYKNFK